jgi:homoserine O-succinyltransferase/O-acetyltransferase
MNQQLTGLRAAILDLNDGTPNRGVGYLQQMLARYPQFTAVDTFDVRQDVALPDLSYDLYLSSGGPGNPLSYEGWGPAYFNWIDQVHQYNMRMGTSKKQIFFICHSFQMACIHFGIGNLTPRHEESFGVWPCFLTEDSLVDPLFRLLPQEFYIADFRKYQVVQANPEVLHALGAEVLAIEQHTAEPERALMAIRFNDHMVGTQFHPEADEIGMKSYLETDDRRLKIIEEYGIEQYNDMVENVNAPDRIGHTYRTLLPNFIRQTIKKYELVLQEN